MLCLTARHVLDKVHGSLHATLERGKELLEADPDDARSLMLVRPNILPATVPPIASKSTTAETRPTHMALALTVP